MFFSVKTAPEPDAVDRAIIRHLEAPPVQQTAEDLFYASIAKQVMSLSKTGRLAVQMAVLKTLSEEFIKENVE